MVLGTHKDIFERTQIGLNISMDKMTPEIEKNDQNRPCDRAPPTKAIGTLVMRSRAI